MKERHALAALLLLALAIRVPTLAQPLVEAHAFRQTQTAYTALLYARDGIDLLHPRVPVLGPPYDLAFEFPLFQAIAAIPIALGLPADPALRGTSLVFFLVSAALLWLLVRRGAGSAAAFATLVAFLFSPLALVWSRTSTVEYLVVAASLTYLLVGLVWRERGGAVPWLIAAVAGAIAMTVKVTSGAVWVLPLLTYRSRRSRRDPWVVALAVVPLALGLLWTLYADELRGSAPGTSWMTSIELAPFLFGTLWEHLSLAPWGAILFTAGAWICGPAILGLLLRVAPGIRATDQRWFWLAFVLCPFLSIAVFLNAWSIHDYYSIAATPSVAVAIGLAAASLWRARALRTLPLAVLPGVVLACLYLGRFAPTLAAAVGALALAVVVMVWARRDAFAAKPRGALIVVGALTLALNLVTTIDYWGVAYAGAPRNEYPLSLAAELDRYTTADESVLMTGGDWSPVVLYYARRQGQMLPMSLLNDAFVASLHSRGYRTFFAWDPAVDALWPATQWPWIGALGPHTFALGESRSDLRGAMVSSTDDVSAFAADGRRVPHPASIRCGDVTEIASQSGSLWLRLGPAGRDARVGVLAAGLGALPARSVLMMSPHVASGGVIGLECAGAATITILDAVEGP